MSKQTKNKNVFSSKIKKVAAVFLGFIHKKYLLGKKSENIIFIEPDYYIVNNLNSKSVVIDIGTGNNADLSQNLIKKFNLKSYGFDPTKKHYKSLKTVEKESDGRFTFLNYALSDKPGKVEFNESTENVSGSFSSDHVNIKRDNINKYPVETITLDGVFSKLSISKANLLKMDVEGEEYKIIDSLTSDPVDKIDQLILEFHHHCIDKYSLSDTLRAIKKLGSFGFEHYSKDGINYLFYRTND